jgi:AraC family transcriptional regulator
MRKGGQARGTSSRHTSHVRSTTRRDYQARILRVLTYLQERLDEDVDLPSLARIACFSPFHFHRVFRGMVGESIQEHLRRLRLERAASRLKRGTSPVTRLAFDAGYRTHESFTRAFKALFGLSPAAYRRAKRPPVPRRPTPRPRPLEVEIRRLPPLRVAFTRHVGSYSKVGAAWDRLLPCLGKEGLLGGGSRFIGVCFDDPDVTPPARIRYEACVALDVPFSPAGDIGLRTIPGGEHAVALHVGPYRRLGETYRRLFGEWLPRSGREARDIPSFEVYLNDPNSEAPKDLLTEIHLPLKGRA